MIPRGSSVGQLSVVPPPLTDELLSSWLARVSSYYRTTTKELLEQIGCVETSLEVLDRSAGPTDLAAVAFAVRVEPSKLLEISFNAVPAPVLNFVSPWAKLRECRRCCVEFHRRGTTAVLRQWCVAFAILCRRCGHPLTPCPWQHRRDEGDTEVLERRSARLCAALEPGLRDGSGAAALARVMAALAIPLPVTARGRSHRRDRPLLWRSQFYRREAGSKARAADPRRPFACWSVPAQLAAICLLDDVVGDDRVWRDVGDLGLVDDDDRDVILDLLRRSGQPVELGPDVRYAQWTDAGRG